MAESWAERQLLRDAAIVYEAVLMAYYFDGGSHNIFWSSIVSKSHKPKNVKSDTAAKRSLNGLRSLAIVTNFTSEIRSKIFSSLADKFENLPYFEDTQGCEKAQSLCDKGEYRVCHYLKKLLYLQVNNSTVLQRLSMSISLGMIRITIEQMQFVRASWNSLHSSSSDNRSS